MQITRREMVGLAALGLAGGTASLARAAEAPGTERRRANRIGVSTYSFWHFRGEPTSIESCLEQAAEIGFDGVEILHAHMEEAAKAAGGRADKPHLRKLKAGRPCLNTVAGLFDVPLHRSLRRSSVAMPHISYGTPE